MVSEYKPPIDWQRILERSILTVAIGAVFLVVSVATCGVFPVVFGIVVFFQYKRARRS